MRDIKVDDGAVGDGVTDDTAAFQAFNTWAAAQTKTVELLMPPGDYILASPYSGNIFRGIKRIVVHAYGASINYAGLGGAGHPTASSDIAAIQTVAAGSNTITLVTVADSSKFSVDQWLMVTALDLQGAGSYPHNHFFNEFVQIEAINAGTGVITLVAGTALRHSYKSTYPDYGGNTGGPATIYGMPASWDTEVKVMGLHIKGDNGSVQTYANGKRIELIDCIFDETVPIPTQNKEFIARCCVVLPTASNVQMEIDKACELVVLENCWLKSIVCQSASVEKLVVDGCHVWYNFNGTPKHLVIKNSDIASLTLGSIGYGGTQSIVLENSRILELLAPFTGSKSISDFSLSHGTLSIAAAGGPITWVFPGMRGFLSKTGNNNYGLPFIVTDIRLSAGNILIDTTLPHTLPTIGGTPTKFTQHPAPRITARGCSGCSAVTDLCQAPDELPVNSYSRRYYTGRITGEPGLTGQAPMFTIWGKLIEITINVIRAYTGAQGTLTSEFMGINFVETINPDYTANHWAPVVNLKIAGKRVINPVAVLGAKTGDNIPAIGENWFVGSVAPYLATDISAEAQDLWPIFEVEIKTDQGISHANVFQTGASLLN